MIKKLLFIFVIILTNTRAASQSNYKSENYGNLSILLNGNVTGSVEDLGLTYYNPARLAIIENTAFSINAKAYQWNRMTLTDAIGIQNELSSSTFNAVPSMVAATFNLNFLKDHHFAIAFISKIRSKIAFNYETKLLQSDFLGDYDGIEKHLEKFDLVNELKDEWFGLTWAKSFSDNFSMGASAFFSIYNHQSSNIIAYEVLHSQNQVSTYTKELSFNQTSYGMYLKVGFAYRKQNLDLGLNITLPYLEVYDKGKFQYEEFLAGMGTGKDIFTFNDFDNLKSTKKVPLGIDLGAGIPLGKSKLHLNIDFHTGISDYERIIIPEIQSETEESTNLLFIEELNAVFNYGIGAEIYVSPKIKGVLSFSSDYSPVDKNSNIFKINNSTGQDVNINFDLFHFGGGLELKLNKTQLVLGGTYTTGNSQFGQPFADFPNNDILDEFATLKLSRWQFIIGVDIPILNKTIKDLGM